jgi:hypothetical protein
MASALEPQVRKKYVAIIKIITYFVRLYTYMQINARKEKYSENFEWFKQSGLGPLPTNTLLTGFWTG